MIFDTTPRFRSINPISELNDQTPPRRRKPKSPRPKCQQKKVVKPAVKREDWTIIDRDYLLRLVKDPDYPTVIYPLIETIQPRAPICRWSKAAERVPPVSLKDRLDNKIPGPGQYDLAKGIIENNIGHKFSSTKQTSPRKIYDKTIDDMKIKIVNDISIFHSNLIKPSFNRTVCSPKDAIVTIENTFQMTYSPMKYGTPASGSSSPSTPGSNGESQYSMRPRSASPYTCTSTVRMYSPTTYYTSRPASPASSYFNTPCRPSQPKPSSAPPLSNTNTTNKNRRPKSAPSYLNDKNLVTKLLNGLSIEGKLTTDKSQNNDSLSHSDDGDGDGDGDDTDSM